VSEAVGVLRETAKHKDLIVGLTRRELFSPFAGSAFGIAWALLHPLLQMGVYLLVFTYIFQIKMGGDDGLADYQAYVLSGLLVWLCWSSLLNTACSTILNSTSLVKQADFPTEVLPLRTMLVCLVPHLVGIGVLGLYVLIRHGGLPATSWLLPLVLALQATAMLGVTYVLGALCVFVRDVKEVVFVLSSLGIFLTPSFYTPSMLETVPWPFRVLIAANPFSHFVNIYRDILYWGELRHGVSWAVVLVFTAVVLVGGRRAFLRLRLFFGNFV
jgi:lipopolysaccharide transport system permease protein